MAAVAVLAAVDVLHAIATALGRLERPSALDDALHGVSSAFAVGVALGATALLVSTRRWMGALLVSACFFWGPASWAALHRVLVAEHVRVSQLRYVPVVASVLDVVSLAALVAWPLPALLAALLGTRELVRTRGRSPLAMALVASATLALFLGLEQVLGSLVD